MTLVTGALIFLVITAIVFTGCLINIILSNVNSNKQIINHQNDERDQEIQLILNQISQRNGVEKQREIENQIHDQLIQEEYEQQNPKEVKDVHHDSDFRDIDLT